MRYEHPMTPGPWRVEIISGDTAQVLAKSYCVADDVRPSDARLIAAAPALLEACKAAIALSDKNAPRDDDGVVLRTQECADCYQQVADAIAKATEAR
jgi:hypothetical protein